MKDKRYKYGCLILAFAMVLSASSSSVCFADEKVNLRSQPVVGDAALRFFEFFYDEDECDTIFPDYYGGMRINDDSSPTFYLTDTSDSVIETLVSICGDDAFGYEQVAHSFNELTDTQMEIMDKYGAEMKLTGSALSIDKNSVVLYTDLEFVDVSPLTDEFDIKCEVMTDVTSCGTLSEDSYTSLAKNESRAQTFKSGLTTYRRSRQNSTTYSEVMGTVGFVALDSDGNKVIFTHGHDIESYWSSLKIGNQTLSFNVFGTGNNNDASYAFLPSSATLNNRIGSTSYYLEGTMTRSAFASISNATVYFYGVTTGTVTQSDFVAQLTDESVYTLVSTSGNVQHGDSGGPIFVSTSSGNQLVGIVKAGASSWSQGVFLTYIKNLYRSETGSTLYVFVNDDDYT